MKTQLNEWQIECENFQNWFASLGGNIANNEQMTEAFIRIEAKSKIDNNLFDAITQQWINQIEVVL